jgi:hypothetical protein
VASQKLRWHLKKAQAGMAAASHRTKADEAAGIKRVSYLTRLTYLLTDYEFSVVRLLHINYSDIKGKVKSYSQYWFLIEDMGDMAKRNKCKEVKAPAFHPNLDRQTDD